MNITGIILAGGQSKRMGANKAFVQIHGVPLVEYVYRQIRPMVSEVVINANDELSRYRYLNCPLVSDLDATAIWSGSGPAPSGPLWGIYSSLRQVFPGETTGYFAAFPCDMPVIPADFVPRACELLTQEGSDVCMAMDPQGLQPLLIVGISTIDRPIEQCIRQHHFGAGACLTALPHSLIKYDQPLRNLNTQAQLERFLEEPSS